ncbi:MAG: RNA polymerase sigma factor [Candidatus Paceibacterota bacterium]
MKQDACKKIFLESFDAYSDAIFRFCLVKTNNKEIAEDLTQETFIRYWQSLRRGSEMSNTRSFLYTIARNLVIDWYRKHKSESLEQIMEGGFQVKDTTDTPETVASYTEILTAIDVLDAHDGEVLMLRFVEGMEPKDIALILNESANTISVRINRALKRLQKQLHI